MACGTNAQLDLAAPKQCVSQVLSQFLFCLIYLLIYRSFISFIWLNGSIPLGFSS